MSTGPGELLESPPARSSGPWLVVAILAVVALIGWNVLGSAAEPAPPEAVETTESWEATQPEREPDRQTTTPPDYVSELHFLDAEVGFGTLNLCSQIGYQRDEPCPRRIIATDDAGVTWEVRGRIPIPGHGFHTLVPLSTRVLTIVDMTDSDHLLRSADGGRSWAVAEVTAAESAMIASQAALVPNGNPRCGIQCPPLSWVDPVTQRRHEFPTQPSASGTTVLQSWPIGPDGDIVVTGTTLRSAYIAMSTDGGQSWTESTLEQATLVQGLWVLPAGTGRAYTFVYATDDGGAAVNVRAYRTDDGGSTWVDITAAQPDQHWNVGAVSDGELIGVDASGAVLVSAKGGTVWIELPNAPALGYITSGADGRTLVGYPIDDWTGMPYYSLDGGQSWRQVSLPGDSGG